MTEIYELNREEKCKVGDLAREMGRNGTFLGGWNKGGNSKLLPWDENEWMIVLCLALFTLPYHDR